MDTGRAWSFGAMTGVLTALIGWLPGLLVGALAETHSAAYQAAHSGGDAIGYWSFMPWRVGFIVGWALTVIPVALVVAWFQGFGPSRVRLPSGYEEEAAALLGLPASGKPGRGAVRGARSAAGGLVFGTLGGLTAGIATMAAGLAIGVAFLILPIGALFLILG